jgi:hypothetical protein
MAEYSRSEVESSAQFQQFDRHTLDAHANDQPARCGMSVDTFLMPGCSIEIPKHTLAQTIAKKACEQCSDRIYM